LRLESKYSETNKKNSYKFLALQFSQPVKKIQVSSSLRLPLECNKFEGFWALLSRAESRTTNMSTAVKIPYVKSVHQEQRRKLTKIINLKRE